MIKQWYYQNKLCAVVESQDARGKMLLIKWQEARGILSNLSLKTPLSKISLLGDIFF